MSHDKYLMIHMFSTSTLLEFRVSLLEFMRGVRWDTAVSRESAKHQYSKVIVVRIESMMTGKHKTHSIINFSRKGSHSISFCNKMCRKDFSTTKIHIDVALVFPQMFNPKDVNNIWQCFWFYFQMRSDKGRVWCHTESFRNLGQKRGLSTQRVTCTRESGEAVFGNAWRSRTLNFKQLECHSYSDSLLDSS
jgi:hypothetical protein